MNKTKQTAVEWFFSELERMQYFIGNDMLEAYNQAKEMEKEKMIKFTNDWYNCYFMTHPMKTAEEYYNETYGGNK